MLNAATKPERSLGSHPRENLNRRVAGKRRHGGPGFGDAAGFGCPEARRTKFTSVEKEKKGSEEGSSPGPVEAKAPWPPSGWRVGGEEAGLERKRPKGWRPA